MKNVSLTSTTVGSTTEVKAAQLLTAKEVRGRIGVSRSTLNALVKRDTFPKKIRLGSRAVRFLENEIENWILARASERTTANSDQR